MPATLTPFVQYADDVMESRYSHVVHGRKESWLDIDGRVCDSVLRGNHMPIKLPNDVYDAIHEMIFQRKFIPGGRILSQAGRDYHQTDNCFTLLAEDTREGWANLAHKTTMMFMSGGGVGVDYSNIRSSGHVLQRSGGISSGPIPLIEMINSVGAAARQGGDRRGAIYASLKWDHPDIDKFIQMKTDGQSLKHTNISVRFDSNWQEAGSQFGDMSVLSKDKVFYDTLKHACQYGDPGFQFDADNQILRNACCEIISESDGDSCCLGSINLAQIDNLRELSEVTKLAILFLMCNTLYTDCPTEQVKVVKDKNRRIGLGLMGIAEWFIQRSLPYGTVKNYHYGYDSSTWRNSINNWLVTWQQATDRAKVEWAHCLSVAIPIATRAIAPTGTISIAGGHTTPGIEPVFHTAYQRTYNSPTGLQRRNIIDPIVQKWIEKDYNVRDIDTAWTLSQTVEGIDRRLKFQVFVQKFVDNAISSTVNLPKYTEGIEEKIAPVLLKYLPELRGVTFYPDGRYDNQPVVPLDITDVLDESDTKVEQYESCKIGDSCGS